jgi:hypothetical protein
MQAKPDRPCLMLEKAVVETKNDEGNMSKNAPYSFEM